MKPTSEIWTQLDWVDTLNATSSQASEDGASPCASQDGQTIVQFGPDPVLANLSARQAEEQGLLMSGTSGRTGTTSSASASLQQSLASKLQARTASAGSTLYRLTWKQRDTPSGRQICALRASARRTSASGYSSEQRGWPTPRAQAFEIADAELTRKRREECKTRNNNGNGFGLTLAQMAVMELTGWPTPAMTDHKGGYQGGRMRDGKLSTDRLDVVAQIAGPARLTASGQMLTGSSAGMESGGQLNPAHSRWLMGYPPEWDDCAVTAMPSSRKSQPRSSRP